MRAAAVRQETVERKGRDAVFKMVLALDLDTPGTRRAHHVGRRLDVIKNSLMRH
jgi:hypothetical protein